MTPLANTRAARQDGFTLIELLTSMAVLSILVAAFATVVASAVRHSGEMEGLAVIQQQTRAALDQLEGDLRQAYTGDPATSPISSVSGTQVTFLSPDNETPFHLRLVSYRLNAGRLERAFATSTDTDGAPWSIPSLGAWHQLADSITNTSAFTFLDQAGAATTTPSAVKTVRVTLTVATTPSSARRFTYTSSITPRADG